MTIRHRADVIDAHQRLRDALSLSRRPTSRAYAIGVFTGRLTQVIADLQHRIDYPIRSGDRWIETHWATELRDRVFQIRDAVTNCYINGDL